MMSEEEFCRMIEKDYIYYMYKAKRGYPFDCHTSANLISSYLTVHFNKKFIHRTFKFREFIHGWTKGENICIDFTGIQFNLGPDREKFINLSKSLNKDEVFEITQKHRIENPLTSSEDMDDLYYPGEFGNEPLYGLEYAKKVNNPYHIDSFMAYVKEAYEEVNRKVNDCYTVNYPVK
ncbi:hypothetical protein EXW93_05720 [Exiguobacterium sp. JMULE1]|uniref:hypothetical protein n=1 Tax=Exiguobacterium sp. JMULE1 TaxID=2518339 RepID=UPI0015771FB5|nr:hypothetical protein [Exiguobacterium sp. JMULE1]NTY09092.1 hypothetical protein [Exiguobacterium sp. JMULE1]